MTSEGGGAVAFHVMTLGFGISPSIARDFSLMIQSCGMAAAAFTIFFMKVRISNCCIVGLAIVQSTLLYLNLLGPWKSFSGD